jgi:hypothetical protein
MLRMSPQERQLFQDGFVSAYIDKIRQVPDRQNVVNKIYNSPAARGQIQIALGPQRATELESMLRVENVMNMARGAIQGNSTMGMRMLGRNARLLDGLRQLDTAAARAAAAQLQPSQRAQ